MEEPNHTGEFDAYISCNERDYAKVGEIVKQVDNRGIKTHSPRRDLLGGTSLPIVTPELIRYRYLEVFPFQAPCQIRQAALNKSCV